jgi:hypothetical protein
MKISRIKEQPMEAVRIGILGAARIVPQVIEVVFPLHLLFCARRIKQNNFSPCA